MPSSYTFYLFMRDLVATTASRDTQAAVDGAAAATLKLTHAAGVSLIFMGPGAGEGHAGRLSIEGDAKLTEWEHALSSRLAKGPLELRSDVVPLSRHSVENPAGTLISAPLRWGRRIVGLVAAEIPGEMSDEASERLQRASPLLGAILGLVFEANSSRRKLGELSMIFQSGQAVVASPQFAQALRNTLTLAARMVDAEGCAALLARPEKDLLMYVARSGAEPADPCPVPLDGIVGWVAENGEAVVTADPSRHPLFREASDGQLCPQLRSLAAVSLQVKGRSVGTLAAFNQQHDARFSDDDLWLLDGVASHVGVVVENDRLYAQLIQERDRVLEAQDAIRNELAHGLHRGPVQLLAALTLALDHAERLVGSRPDLLGGELASIRSLARQAAREARLLLFELRPATLETDGLSSALRSYVSQLQSDKPPAFHCSVPELGQPIEPKIARVAFGIVQEALSNAIRHATAQNIWLEVREQPGEIVIDVRDDGQGFDVEDARRRSEAQMRLGLSAMHRQAELIGATLHIQSSPDASGALVTLRIPLGERQE